MLLLSVLFLCFIFCFNFFFFFFFFKLVMSLTPPPPPGYTWSLPSCYLCRISSPLFLEAVLPSNVSHQSAIVEKANGAGSQHDSVLLSRAAAAGHPLQGAKHAVNF